MSNTQRPTPDTIHAEATIAGRHIVIVSYATSLEIDSPCVVPAMDDSWRNLVNEHPDIWQALTDVDALAKTDLESAVAQFKALEN